MARYNLPGLERVWYTATLSTPSAPSAAEIAAGVDLTGQLRGTPEIPETGNKGVSADLSSDFEKRQATTYGGDDLVMEVYRDPSGETAYSTLTRLTTGYVVDFRQGIDTGTTPALGDICDVYAIEVLSRAKGVPDRDEMDFAIITAAITDDPNVGVTCVT